TRAVLRPVDLPNVDWEALGAGPCSERWCLHVGDVGDNRGVRRSIAIYRIVEPVLDGSGAEIAAPVLDRQEARYPDGPHDAEAIVVAGDRDVYVLTKGREGWAGAYHLPPARWDSSVVAL